MENEKDKTLEINTKREQRLSGNIPKPDEEKKEGQVLFSKGGEKPEGWFKFSNAKKWHYLVEGKSLCRKYFFFGWKQITYEQGNEKSPDNCKVCLKKLLKRKETLTDGR